MSRKATTSPLRTRLAELSISAEELAELIGRRVSDVMPWVEGKTEPDAGAKVLLRFLSNEDSDALRRVAHLRRTNTRNLEADGVRYGKIENIPYGTHDVNKTTGGVS
jgi:hypothetical protein